MKSKLVLVWENVRSSYWFLPLLFALSGYLLHLAGIIADSHLRETASTFPPWKTFHSTSAAQQFLATIVGSIMTLIGVVFSLTMIALIMASSQYGLRLLRNFMKDVMTQSALGIFVATFIYCLMTFRSIRSSPEGDIIPHLTITIALTLTILSIIVLVIFIHHISVRIQAPTVISELAKELLWSIDQTFPKKDTETPGADHEEAEMEKRWEERHIEEAKEFTGSQTGYIQAIDFKTLCCLAEEGDAGIELYYGPGDFILPGQHLGKISANHKIEEDLDKKVMQQIIIGASRTTKQDVKFAFEQMIEVAQKALSPGINEPLVAMMCIDYAALALIEAAKRPRGSCFFLDSMNAPRVKSQTLPFAELFLFVFGTIGYYANFPALVLVTVDKASQVTAYTRTPEEKEAFCEFTEMMRKKIDEKTWSNAEQRNFETCVSGT